MEIQIQDLITSIKTDGIEKAKAEAAEIISKAKAEAEAIIRDANQEREKILSNARREIETESRSAEEKLRQAARDASLTFKKSVDDEIAKIMKEAVDTSLDSDCLSRLIESVVSSSFVADAEITISESDKDKVASGLINALSQKLKKGLTLKTSSLLSGGFIVKASDGSGYFDLSDDEIAKLLYPYLSENLRKLL